jgi:hypothetical protein
MDEAERLVGVEDGEGACARPIQAMDAITIAALAAHLRWVARMGG